MIISTTNINEKYDVIDVVFNLHTIKPKGFLGSGGLDMEEGFNSAKAALLEKCRARGGDAIIGCEFDVRIAIDGGLAKNQVLEIYCWGTVVKLTT